MCVWLKYLLRFLLGKKHRPSSLSSLFPPPREGEILLALATLASSGIVVAIFAPHTRLSRGESPLAFPFSFREMRHREREREPAADKRCSLPPGFCGDFWGKKQRPHLAMRKRRCTAHIVVHTQRESRHSLLVCVVPKRKQMPAAADGHDAGGGQQTGSQFPSSGHCSTTCKGDHGLVRSN